MTITLLVGISALVLAAWLWFGKLMWTTMNPPNIPGEGNDDDS